MSAPDRLPPVPPPVDSDRRLQLLCDHFPGGVTVMDHELRLLLWNRRFLEVNDLPESMFEQPITLPDLWRFNIARGEFGPVQDAEALVADFTTRALRFEAHAFTRQRPNGRVLEIRGEPIAGNGGFVTTWVDVTEHQRLQTQLNRHEALATQVVNHLPQGLSLFDEELRLLLWNAAFVDMLEFPPEAIFRGARFEDLLRLMAERGDYGPGAAAEQVAQRLALARQFAPHRLERTRPNGRTHLVEGRPVMYDGRVAGFVTTYTDITAQKVTEHALRQANEHLSTGMAEHSAALSTAQGQLSRAIAQLAQAEKLAALGNLVAGVAHELNTPIGNGRLAATTLEDRVSEFAQRVDAGPLRRATLNEFVRTAQETAQLVSANLERAAELIAAFKQVTVDQTSMRRREFLLDEVVEKTVATLRHLLRQDQHRLVLELPHGLALDSYPGALEQVLTNLINNSLIHGFDGRQRGCIRIAACRDADAVLLHYSDDGRGFDAEASRRAFEPFFTRRLNQGGSGLGLHIARQLVEELMGGELRLQAPTGSGACFEMRLPLKAPTAD